MAFYSKFNYILVIFGLHLCPDGIARLVNKVARTLLLIWLLLAIPLELQKTLNLDLKSLEQFANYLVIAIIVWQQYMRSQSIRRMLHKVQRLSSLNDKRRFRKLETSYVIGIVAFHAMAFAIAIIDWTETLNSGEHTDWLYQEVPPFIQPRIAVLLFVFKEFYTLLTSFLLTIFNVFYLFMVIVIVQLQSKFLSTLTVKMNATTATTVWLLLCDIKLEFEDSFTIFPLLSFFSLLAWSTTYITHIYKGVDIQEAVIEITLLTLCASILVYLLHVIDAANIHFARTFYQFRKTLRMSNAQLNQEMCALVDEVRENLDLKLTAFGMFYLNKSILIGFISALMSSTVLFVQWVK